MGSTSSSADLAILDHPRLRYLRENLIGNDAKIDTPFGPRRRVYFDYIASGVAFEPIERVIMEQVLPNMANTHTESNSSGRNMTHLVEDAYRHVSRVIGADERDVVIFTGSGSTAAINRIILAMGLRIPDQISSVHDCKKCLPDEARPIIFRSMMEHHSNDISWRETVGETRFVGFDKSGRIDWRDLERQLKLPEVKDRPFKIGTFSAASNVTGILNEVDALSAAMHEEGGYAFYDYAAAAPYVKVEMHPDDDPAKRKDAIFVSTHKFIGGPQTPGILAANTELFTNDVPVEPGGGTVLYTSPWDHHYLSDVKLREAGGTPPIVQIIRTGMVFQLKEYLGADLILEAEHAVVDYARKRFEANDAISILGDTDAERLGVFSIIFHEGRLHHNLAVRLLNDLYGIQVRAGCMCAGTYGHELLKIEQQKSEQIRQALEEGDLWSKPGWVRISISPATSPKDIDYLLEAIDTVAADWERYAHLYEQDNAGEFLWKGNEFEEIFLDLDLRLPEEG